MRDLYVAALAVLTIIAIGFVSRYIFNYGGEGFGVGGVDGEQTYPITMIAYSGPYAYPPDPPGFYSFWVFPKVPAAALAVGTKVRVVIDSTQTEAHKSTIMNSFGANAKYQGVIIAVSDIGAPGYAGYAQFVRVAPTPPATNLDTTHFLQKVTGRLTILSA